MVCLHLRNDLNKFFHVLGIEYADSTLQFFPYISFSNYKMTAFLFLTPSLQWY